MPLSTSLSWENGGNAQRYDVYLSTSDDIRYDDVVSEDETATSYDLPDDLAAGTTYYWRVDSINGGGTTVGNVWSFTTLPPSPEPATSPTPADLAQEVSTSVVLSWVDGGHATEYDVYLGTSEDALSRKSLKQAGLTYSPGTLQPDMTYSWRIDAYNSSVSDPVAGTIWEFTTAVSQTTAAPEPPIDPRPLNRATGVASNARLSWNDGGNSDTYDVYFGESSPPGLRSSDQTATTFDPPTLKRGIDGTTYYWRIVAKNQAGDTSSATWSFTTLPDLPSAPLYQSPANGATDQSTETQLRWQDGGGADTYTVYLGATNPPAQVRSGYTSTSYDPALTEGLTYYWRVAANNQAGSTLGSVWSFTTETEEEIEKPEKAENPYPSDAEPEAWVHDAVTWDDGGGADAFDLYLGTDPTPDSGELISEDQTELGYLPDLYLDTTYYWRVDSWNDGGRTRGDVWSFTTYPDHIWIVCRQSQNKAYVVLQNAGSSSNWLGFSLQGTSGTIYDVPPVEVGEPNTIYQFTWDDPDESAEVRASTWERYNENTGLMEVRVHDTGWIPCLP